MICQAVIKICVVNKNNNIIAIVKTKQRAMQYCKDFPNLHIEEKFYGWRD